jgi:hypothetical protein
MKERIVMRSKIFQIATAAVAAGFVAFGGSQLAFAACQEDLAAVKAAIDKEQDPAKKQKATEELMAAQQAADEDNCNNHLQKAKEHLKK